jgi:small subunit ribosomal protein S18
MSRYSNTSSSAPEGAEGGAKQAAVRRPFFRRQKACPFTGPEAQEIDYKNARMLSRFVSERGKIMPSRISSVCAKKQRALAAAIKRARFLGLMAYASAR